jgi:hypothetical protein
MFPSITIDLGIYALIIVLSYFVWRKYEDKTLLRYVYIGLALTVITLWQFFSTNFLHLGGSLQILNMAIIQILRLLVLALLIALILKRRQ